MRCCASADEEVYRPPGERTGQKFDREEDRRMASRRHSSSALNTRARGFTLIEVMIVVAIIGVISSIALPSLQAYVWKARRNEAFLNLNGIYKSQVAYRVENGRYGSTFDEIGFEISGATVVDATTLASRFYTYTLEAIAVDGVANANYSAVATGDLDPSDAMLDIIMIESGLIITD